MNPPTQVTGIWNFAPEPIKKIYIELSSQWKSCEQKFQVWTNKTLKPAHAEKANKVFSALPIIALTYILPWKVSITLLFVGYAVDIAYPIDRELYNTIHNGIAVGTGLLALSSAFQFLTTFNPLELLAAFIYGSISKATLPKGNLFA